MRKLELLLDVLEASGFRDIRAKIQERDEELRGKATLRAILTIDEINEVKRTLRGIRLPRPTGWADAMYMHEMSDTVENFHEDTVYDYTELCNLYTTLNEAGLTDKEIWQKIETAKNTLKIYSE